jgi:hypothetical protein
MVYNDQLYNVAMKYEHGVVRQEGQGLSDWWDTIKEYGAKAKELASKAGDIYSSELATTIKNALPSSDENDRPQFAGEKHVVLKLPNGKIGFANWAGPGTRVLARVKRGDPPRTYVDKIAKTHDIDYSLSGGDPKKVREADDRMLKSLEIAKKDKKDSDFNINGGLMLMKAKTMAEDLNLLKKGSFASNQPLTNEDKEVLEKEAMKLKQEGFGKAKKELLKHVSTGKGVVRSGDRMVGNGVRQAGAGVVRSGDTKMVGSGVVRSGDKMMGKGVRQAGAGVVRSGDSKMTGGAMPFLQKFIPVVLKLAKKDGNLDEMKKLFKNPLIMKGTKNILTGSGKPSKEMIETMGGFAKKYADIIKNMADKEPSEMKKIMKGSGFLQTLKELGQGFAYGWNQAKGVMEKIPVVGEAFKKVPAIPGAAMSLDELAKQTGHNRSDVKPEAFPWTREEWDKMSGKAKKFTLKWYQGEMDKYRAWVKAVNDGDEDATHAPAPKLENKPTDAEIEAINKSVNDDPLVKFARSIPKAKLDKDGRVMRDKDGNAITGSGRRKRKV